MSSGMTTEYVHTASPVHGVATIERGRSDVTRTRVLPYKPGSKSAKALAEGLGVLRLKTSNSKFRARNSDVIINWGSSYIPQQIKVAATVLNKPFNVGRAANKLAFFNDMAENAPEVIPEFWTYRDEIPEDAYPIVCRTVLNGHSGEGIVIADTEDELVDAPLYVKYIKKDQEYRIHVAGGEVISVQRKARKYDVPDDEVNWRIRNHGNGFVFARNEVEAPDEVTDVATRAVGAMGLDFGAADVVYTRDRKAFVLEINTAPGLEGTTLTDYVNYFRGGNDED